MRELINRLFRSRLGRLVTDPVLLRFASIGLLTTLLDIVLFSLLSIVAGLPVILANVLSYSCGIVTSFVLNRSWTFQGIRGDTAVERQAMRFIASNLAGLTLSSLLVGLFVLFLPKVAAKLVSVPIVFLWNYSIARLWVFR